MMWHRPEGFVLGGSGRAHLKVDGLAAGYGPVQVLRGLRFEARPGLTVILGPNGAGKTTLLRALAGLIPRGGEVLLDGEELPEKTHEIVRAGVALVAEGRQLFPQMTVTENLELGGWLVPKAERERRLPGLHNAPIGSWSLATCYKNGNHVKSGPALFVWLRVLEGIISAVLLHPAQNLLMSPKGYNKRTDPN